MLILVSVYNTHKILVFEPIFGKTTDYLPFENFRLIQYNMLR